MAQQVNISDSIELIPSSFDTQNSVYASENSSYPIANGYTNSDSSSYAQFNIVTGSGANTYIYYRFDASSIPQGAIITSISCTAKGYINTTNSSRITTRQIYLCTGTTAKGTASTISNSTTELTLSAGSSWTYEEVQNIGVCIHVQRGTSNTTSTYNVRFYGATLTISYSLSGMQYLLTAVSEVNGATIEPLSADVIEGNSQEFIINLGTNALTDIKLTDNNEDVTSELVQHTVPTGGTISAVPASYSVISGSVNGTRYQSTVGCGVDNPSSQTGNDYSGSSGSTATIAYTFNFDDIPSNATITNVNIVVRGHLENTSQSQERADFQAYSGNTAKGSVSEFTSTSNTNITLSAGTWTRAELNSAAVRFTIGYYGGLIVGITWTVEYEMPSTGSQYYYTYTLSNVSADHDLVLGIAGAFEPPEEDPEYTYYSITTSSLNATTDPRGTIRVVEGSNQTITITPSDPQLTLALDNGVDITSQLVGGAPNNTYTITTKVSGASYGFNLNSSTGYYVSSNNGVSKSASVARLNMNFESSCLVTIQYINYAEASYDYGMFGKLDTAVATDGLSAGSNGSSPSDSTSNYQLAMASNSSAAQTISYNVPAGEHFIDIKYGKDDASNSNDDSLQWKVLSVEATGAGGDYTYTLSNIQQKHSLIFVFGDVDYYFITSSGTDCRLYPDGQMVELDGNSYVLTIVPDNVSATVTLLDNGNNRTSSLVRVDGVNKNNEPIVNYTYTIDAVTATHNITVSCDTGGHIFIKVNNTWREYSKVFKKVNGTWVEQQDLSNVFNTSANYVQG